MGSTSCQVDFQEMPIGAHSGPSDDTALSSTLQQWQLFHRICCQMSDVEKNAVLHSFKQKFILTVIQSEHLKVWLLDL